MMKPEWCVLRVVNGENGEEYGVFYVATSELPQVKQFFEENSESQILIKLFEHSELYHGEIEIHTLEI